MERHLLGMDEAEGGSREVEVQGGAGDEGRQRAHSLGQDTRRDQAPGAKAVAQGAKTQPYAHASDALDRSDGHRRKGSDPTDLGVAHPVEDWPRMVSAVQDVSQHQHKEWPRDDRLTDARAFGWRFVGSAL